VANAKGNPKNLKPVLTKEEAKKRGAAGGKKSGEVRRRKRDAKKTAQIFLELAAKDNLDKNLEKLGVPERERTNMMAAMASMFTQAMGGNVKAFTALMDYAGYNPKDILTREMLEKDNEEPDTGNTEGEHEDVVIYLPDNGRDKDE